MVREHGQPCLVVDVIEHLFEDRIATFVVFFDDPVERSGSMQPVGRMVGFAEPPEQVVDAVGSVEQAEEESLVEAVQLVEHHRFALPKHLLALVQKRGLVDPAVDQPVMVLGHSGRVKRSHGVGQLPGVIGRRTDRKQRGVGVVVDRRGIQLEGRFGPNQMEPHHAANRLQHPELELHAQPIAPTAPFDFHQRRLPVAVNPNLAAVVGHFKADLKLHGPAGLRAQRAEKMRQDFTTRAGLHLDDAFPFPIRSVLVRRVPGRHSQRSPQIGHAHAREHAATDRVGWIGAGTTQNGRRHAGLREHLPDASPSLQIDDLRRHERVLLLVAIQSQLGQISLRIAAEEVEYAMAAGIQTGGEGRPGHRRLCRVGGGDASVAAEFSQPGHVG